LHESSLSAWILFAGCEFLAYFFVVVDSFTWGEIFHLEKLPDFYFALLVWTMGCGNSFGPLDGFLM
jgi:hypothetical protein